MSFQSEKTQLAESLRRALDAMHDWTPARCLQYEVTLGIVDRKADFTTDFGGEASPEPDSVATLVAPRAASLPLIKLLYLLNHSDDICLDAPTARSITGEPFVHGQPVIAGLLHVLKDAETARFVRRTAPEPRALVEADRDTIVGLTLTDQGRRFLEDALHDRAGAASPLRAAARGT